MKKLVRDKYIDIIKDGKVYHHVQERLPLELFADKVREEAEELAQAILNQDIDSIVEESADMTQLVGDILGHHKVQNIVLQSKVVMKNFKYGGFHNLVILEK